MAKDYPYHARGEWAIRRPNFVPITLPVPEVFVHHDVFRHQKTFEPATMRALEEAEVNRDGGGVYVAIAYTVSLAADGTQTECRPPNVRGGATLNHNGTSLAACWPGNYRDRDILTLDQVNSFGDWMAKGIRVGTIAPNARIRDHAEVFPTACSSNQSRWWINSGELRKIVERHLNDTLPPPTPAPAPIDWHALRAYLIERCKVEVADGPILKLAKPMMRGAEVTWWQHALNVTRKAGIEADGYYGLATTFHTVAFQRAAGIEDDGIVGPQTRKAMVFVLSVTK